LYLAQKINYNFFLALKGDKYGNVVAEEVQRVNVSVGINSLKKSIKKNSKSMRIKIRGRSSF